MIVEYQMQMLVDGEWKHARYPTGQGYRHRRNPTELSMVEADVPKLRAEWEKNGSIIRRYQQISVSCAVWYLSGSQLAEKKTRRHKRGRKALFFCMVGSKVGSTARRSRLVQKKKPRFYLVKSRLFLWRIQEDSNLRPAA